MSKKLLYWDNPQDVIQLVTSLRNNKISICTTDTVLGLLAITTKASFEQLNDIKGRFEKPYLILIPSKEAIYEFSPISNENLKRLIDHCWPGPVTLIVQAKESVPDFMKSKEGTIALRYPDHKGLQTVMNEVGPLFSTSANLAGEPVSEGLDQIKPEILEKIDLVITDRKKEGESIPSTILDCTNPEKINIVRQGLVSKKDLSALIE